VVRSWRILGSDTASCLGSGAAGALARSAGEWSLDRLALPSRERRQAFRSVHHIGRAWPDQNSGSAGMSMLGMGLPHRLRPDGSAASACLQGRRIPVPRALWRRCRPAVRLGPV